MSDPGRWSIDELRVRYDLEPQLEDIFVEGAFDKEILSVVCAQSDRRTTFYEIDVVDIPEPVLSSHGLTSGNKQRVIALSKELEVIHPDARVACLVDRDLDHWFGATSNTPRLRWTVYCSIESHFITQEVVSDITITTGGVKLKNPQVYIASLFDVLKTLYAMRLVDRELSFSLSWVALKKYLIREGDAIQLDVERYVDATLGKNAKMSEKANFSNSLYVWLERLDGDIRLFARGHDYTELLAWTIGEFNGHQPFKQKIAIERLLVLMAKRVSTIIQELP